MPASPADPSLIAHRYRLGARLGEGASGIVDEAVDAVTGQTVAIKRACTGAEDLRRERVALARVRLRCVARLLDEGEDDGLPFLVLERAQGVDFPGPRPGGLGDPWTQLVPALRSLLQALASLHAAGVYHLDLKPGHALTDPAGRVTLIDLGLASGPGVEARPGMALRSGSLAWAAPERILGEEAGPGADLYAVGLMVWQALAGRGPHAAPVGAALRAARVRLPPAPIGSACPGLPPRAQALIDALVARRPEDRPASAWQALEALDEATGRTPARPLERPPAQGPDDLQPLFLQDGADPHGPADAALALWRRSGGSPATVHEELAAWERQGFVGPEEEGGRRLLPGGVDALRANEAAPLLLPAPPPLDEDAQALLVMVGLAFPSAALPPLARALGWDELRAEAVADRLVAAGALHRLPAGHLRPRCAAPLPAHLASLHQALADALPADDPAALRHRMAAGAPIAEPALQLAWAAHRAGHLPAELRLIHLALADARHRRDEARERRAQLALARRALVLGTAEALDRAQVEAQRPGAAADPALVALLHAAALAHRREGARALAAAPPLGSAEPERAQLVRMVRLFAATAVDEATFAATFAAVGEDVARSGDPRARWWWAGWEARERYRQGDYTGAALAQETLAAALPVEEPLLRAIALTYAASAWLEAGDLSSCRRAAEEARAQAATCRLALYEARARWLSRAAQHRAGEARAVDEGLLHLAQGFGDPTILGFIALTEAAVAFWIHDDAARHRCAGLAREAFTAAQLPAGRALARALLAVHPFDEAEARTLLTEARDAPIPDIDWQVLALLAPSAGPEWRALARARAGAAPNPSLRRELLSPQEALGRLHN